MYIAEHIMAAGIFSIHSAALFINECLFSKHVVEYPALSAGGCRYGPKCARLAQAFLLSLPTEMIGKPFTYDFVAGVLLASYTVAKYKLQCSRRPS
jgi:hypothetical protein